MDILSLKLTRGGSIRSRLVFGTLGFSVLTLSLAAFALLGLFQSQLDEQVQTELENNLIQLIALTDAQSGDRYSLRSDLSEQRYRRPLSGWVWQVTDRGRVVMQSQSLGPLHAQSKPLALPLQTVPSSFDGPLGQVLIGMSRQVTPRFGSQALHFSVARPREDIIARFSRFRFIVLIVLSVLAVGQLLGALWLMRVALHPLQQLRDAIEQMRNGKHQGLASAHWPIEISPVADELVALDAHVLSQTERGRTQAADLAHTLKTPLAVLQQLADDAPDDLRANMRRQNARIDAALTRHFALARVRGNRIVQLAEVADEIIAALDGVAAQKGVVLRAQVPVDLMVRCEENDLYEIIGNLVDNGIKWARAQVFLSVAMQGRNLIINVKDDGPGVEKELRHTIVQSGKKMDESLPGQGLGLSIVVNLCEVYGGTLEFDDADIGGFSVTATICDCRIS